MEKKMKIIRFSSIFFVNLGVKEVIDAILTPWMMVELGYLITLTIMIMIYILIGIISIQIYDRFGTDCLWIEEYKHSQSKGVTITPENRLIRFIEKWAKKSEKLLGLLLSFKNPGLYVIFFRNGSYLFNGFTGKNIKIIFLVNIIIINIYWSIIIFTGIPLFVFIWDIIKKFWGLLF